MKKENVIFKCYHDISLKSEVVKFIDSSDHQTLDQYIITTVDFVLNESTKCQQYKLKRETNEVYTIIKSILDNEEKEHRHVKCEEIAKILLDTELKVMKGAIKPSEGALVQTIIKKEDNRLYYALIKNEFFKAINRETIKKIEAFLYDEKKKSPLKICIFEIEKTMNDLGQVEYNLLNAYVDDSIQSNHGPTWYDNFLGLEKCNNNEVNTNNALDKIISFWEKNIEDKNQVLDIRNDTISYFRNEDTFDLDQYIEKMDDRNQLDSMDKEKLFKGLKELPSSRRKGFDYRFDIAQNQIKKRIITKKFYPLKSRKIILSIEGNIDFNDIHVEQENEDYILKIRTNDEETIECLTNRKTDNIS